MSDKALRQIWGVSLMVEGICAVILGVLNIMGSELTKTLTPILCVFILFAVAVMFCATAQIQKRRKK